MPLLRFDCVYLSVSSLLLFASDFIKATIISQTLLAEISPVLCSGCVLLAPFWLCYCLSLALQIKTVPFFANTCLYHFPFHQTIYAKTIGLLRNLLVHL